MICCSYCIIMCLVWEYSRWEGASNLCCYFIWSPARREWTHHRMYPQHLGHLEPAKNNRSRLSHLCYNASLVPHPRCLLQLIVVWKEKGNNCSFHKRKRTVQGDWWWQQAAAGGNLSHSTSISHPWRTSPGFCYQDLDAPSYVNPSSPSLANEEEKVWLFNCFGRLGWYLYAMVFPWALRCQDHYYMIIWCTNNHHSGQIDAWTWMGPLYFSLIVVDCSWVTQGT